MVRHSLPIVNSDDGTWGDILRWYLSKEHYNNDTDDATNNGGHQNVTIRGGTTTAAPITFASGVTLTSATAGAMEYDGNYFYLTTSAATRKKVAIYNDASGAAGDTYYRDSSGNFTRLAAATNGNMLTLASGIPSWTASIVGMALNNTNTITVKDGSFTLQNTSDTTKQANFSLASNTTGTTRTYTLPDITDTLAAKGRDVDPLWQRSGNMIYDGSFENNAAWTKAFGTMTTSQFYNGKQSRQLTSTGAGVNTDRLTLTHDGVGNPISVELIPWAVTLGEIQIRKSASNTGSGSLYLRVRYKDGSGVEQLATSVTISEASISSSAWTYFNNITFTNPQTQSLSYYLTLEIDSTVPSGNVYYLDQTDFVDVGVLSGWQGTNLTMSSLILDNSNVATLKDGSFTLQNTSDTTKQANFSLASNTTGTTRTYTMPDASTTLVGIDTTQVLTNKTLSGSSNTITNLGSSVSSFGTYASMPAAGNVGRLYHCSDVDAIFRDNGSSWDRIKFSQGGTTQPVPPSTGWTSQNLGSNTLVADKDSRLLTCATNGATSSWRYETRSLASTYTATACIECPIAAVNFWQVGMILRNSSSGSFITFGIRYDSGFSPPRFNIPLTKWTSNTASSADYGVTNISGSVIWFRITDDGTNRKYWTSPNGVDWMLNASNSRTDFITADQIGWGANPNNDAIAVRLRSWQVV